MAIGYIDTPTDPAEEAICYLFSSIAAGSSVLKIKESISDAIVNTPPTIAQNLENTQTQVIYASHDSRSQKVCERFVFLGMHNSHWRYVDSDK